jgi:FkbM family methyltransferase
MRQIAGFWWPDDVGEKWRHSLRHVQALDWTLQRCKGRRTAVQAGGNMGLWPRRMKEAGFQRVLSFEPDAESRACLERNAPGVEIFSCALGAGTGTCGIKHRSLGSHNVVEGDSVDVIGLDSLKLETLDLLQLDVEGYEWHALLGAANTIELCRPLVHLELRGFAEKFGRSDGEIRDMLRRFGYREVQALPGNDFVFEPLRREGRP